MAKRGDMKNVILIMDDDERRLHSMNALIAGSYPHYETVLINNAPDTINWLKGNLSSAVLISLDHDLGPNRERDGEVFDPGTGRDVVDYLVTKTPVCPVIVHTTNHIARDGMLFALEGAGWKTCFVVPQDDLEWIHGIWKTQIKKYLNA